MPRHFVTWGEGRLGVAQVSNQAGVRRSVRATFVGRRRRLTRVLPAPRPLRGRSVVRGLCRAWFANESAAFERGRRLGRSWMGHVGNT